MRTPSRTTRWINLMETHTPLVFKTASEDWEFDLIHQLNYKTFVEEIPQHSPSPTTPPGGPVSRGKYLPDLPVRPASGRDAGLARQAAIFTRPKTSQPGFVFCQPGRSLCEIRLLSVDKKFRTGQVFQGLMATGLAVFHREWL